MRVLVLHSRYLSGPASGENRVVDDEIRLLREAGHDVTAWTPSLSPTPGRAELAAAGLGTVWSHQASARVNSFLRERSVDVVHVHNLFPSLSPSVIRAADSQGVKVVATLHNYRLLCLPATFLRQGRPCEDCLGRLPWPGVIHRCYRSSTAASASLATSLTVHRNLGTFDRVAMFLAVSEFVRGKHIQAGFQPGRIRVKPNFAWAAQRRVGPGRYFLYLGRLSSEKGLSILLQAWEGVDAPLLIAGDGPDRVQLERVAPHRVEFLGPVPPGKAQELVREARALILPSTSYEGAPRTIPEAYAAGVPMIGSRMGGIPESVEDGKSGLLIRAGDAGSLREAAMRLMDEATAVELGEGAYRLWLERYRPDQALTTLEDVYAGVREEPSGSGGLVP